jgi:hypothetical protein
LPSKEQTPEITQAKPTVRRKARNENASLQALLANKKPEAPKTLGYGLDFMDFMADILDTSVDLPAWAT